MSSPVQFGGLQRTLLRRAAVHYAQHGWPVAPGAFPTAGGFRCDRAGCPTRSCHPAIEDWWEAASRDPATVATWWSRRGHSVLFPTGISFDVIETPADLGESAARRHRGPSAAPSGGRPRSGGLTARCPVAVTPTGRWMFFVRPGEELRRELAERLTVLLHADCSWVPAPPTRFPEGKVWWQVSPAAVGWQLGDPRKVQRVLVRAGEPERAGPEYVVSPRLRSAGNGGSPESCRTTARR
jgi:hypothetical protein